jgi:two-component system, NarL family, sensor kinase
MAQKLGYVVSLPRWGWMLGTGIYLDDVDDAKRALNSQSTQAIHRTMLVIAIIAVIAALLVAAGGLALNLSEQRVADAKLRVLAQQVVRSQEVERARISRELHDGVTQLLVSVKFIFESALARIDGDRTLLAQTLERGLIRLNDVLRETRSISHALRPALLDDLGLASALEHIAREFSERSGIAVTVKAAACDNRLPEATATALFRIAQECLNNVEQHAHAQHVDINLERDRKHATLSVSDDGCGFDVAYVERQAKKGIGLSNMRERLDALGGTLTIRSGSEGTTIVAQVPKQRGGQTEHA